jgi:predicted NUDIX family NTP pyrophosphohydrolase
MDRTHIAMARRAAPRNVSAGLLLFRKTGKGLEVLLGHPGGPFWARKDDGAWTIPKGLIARNETPLAAAKREFSEETGHQPRGRCTALGEARQPGGKLVIVFAIEGDWDASNFSSNMFSMEWPPKSGQLGEFPELDRAEWFSLEEAERRILKGQVVFLKRLKEAVSL